MKSPNILSVVTLLYPVYLCLLTCTVQGQVYEKPTFGSSSNPELLLNRIECKEGRTLLYLSITNKRLGGTFCMDRNTYLRNSLGEETYRLIEMANIPACPERYRFRSIGETRDLVLHFPELGQEIEYIDLVEECNEDCLTVKYICLDDEVNGRINEGFSLYAAGRLDQALAHFEHLLRDKSDNHSPVFGTLYLYLMTISYDMGDSGELRKWYNELKASSVVNRQEVIQTAREEGLIR